MTCDLPRPGTIWNQRMAAPFAPPRPMRVIFAEEGDVVANNCELAESARLFSWRGTAAEFFARFEPGDPEEYPRTAH